MNLCHLSRWQKGKMNPLINIVKFVGFTLGSVVIRKTYNWLTEDVDPEPGTKEFGRELRMTEIKYKRLRRKYESYIKSNKYIAKNSDDTC
jgi:hypothetical protein